MMIVCFIFFFVQRPVSFIKVGLKRALPYPIQCLAEQFVRLMIGAHLLVVS